MEKGENAGNPAFSPFPTMFFYFPNTGFSFSVTVTSILLFANAFNFNHSKILLFDTVLIPSYIYSF